MLVIKMDFEKAFDTIEHQAIVDILRVKGFGDKWICWMHLIFTSATSVVMLNGFHGKKYYYRTGVRQGDPLSPLISVLSADLLQSILNKASILSIITPPLQVYSCPNSRVVQYADDTLVLMQANAK